MSVEVTDHTATIAADATRKVSLALRLMLDAIDRISIPNTPMDKGDLRNNKLKQVLGLHAVIQWRQMYAVFQEDKQFGHYTTPGTGPHFAENAVGEVVADGDKYFRSAGI